MVVYAQCCASGCYVANIILHRHVELCLRECSNILDVTTQWLKLGLESLLIINLICSFRRRLYLEFDRLYSSCSSVEDISA